MAYWRYWKGTLRTACGKTWSVFGRVPAVLSIVIAVAGFVFFSTTKGLTDQSVFDAATYLIAGLEALVAIVASVLVVNLGRARVAFHDDVQRRLRAYEAEISDLRQEHRRRVDDVTRVGEDFLLSSARLVMSGSLCELREAANVAEVINAGLGEVQLNWAVPYRDGVYQLAIKSKECFVVRHSKSPNAVGIAFVPLDSCTPAEIEITVVAFGEAAPGRG